MEDMEEIVASTIINGIDDQLELIREGQGDVSITPKVKI